MKIRSVVSVLCIGLIALSSEAIIIRHDKDSAYYEATTAEFPFVFFLERQGNRKVCVATLIHAQWAITAAHCAEETMLGDTLSNGRRFAVELAGQTHEIDVMIVHPDYDQSASTDVDLALLRFRDALSEPSPVPLHLDNDEDEQVVSLLGWGFFGIGTTGRQYDDGILRLAQNRIVEADARLRIVFDDPRDLLADVLELEGMPGLGDSGGPAFISHDSGYSLAGIVVGEVEDENFSEERQGQYGAVAVYERISRHLAWIEAVIGSKLPFES